jgi:hypothetical protein
MRSQARTIPCAARLLATLLLAAFASCRARDISFKSITFENAPRDVVFDECRKVVAAHYYSTKVYVDFATGHIETDPVEESVGRDALRQQVYVRVETTPKGEVVVELMATLAKLEVDPSRTPAAEWKVYSSDVIVEGRLLDEISGRVLSLAQDAKVIANTLPKEARPR